MGNPEFNAIAVRDYYPTNENPGNSIWVYDQVLNLKNFGINSFVISPTPYIPGILRNHRRFYLYPKHSSSVEVYKDTYVIRPPYLKLPSQHFAKLNLYFQKKIILKHAKGLNPYFIHAHFGRNGVASLPLKIKLGIPLITYFYGDDVGIEQHGRELHDFYIPLINNGDLFLALSDDMKNDLINIGFPEKKIIVHHLGIDVSLFKQDSQEYAKKNDKIVICSVGRFHENKGAQDTIYAFSRLAKEMDNIELRIVGDGPYIDNLKNLAKTHNLHDRIVFINNFKSENPRETVINEMKTSDIFILTPFMNNSGMKTGTPVVLMEAQALGLPCISTNYAGIPEVLDFGKSGILVEQRDRDQIYQSLKFLCLNNSVRSELGRRGRVHVEKEFNQNTQMRILADIYKKYMI